MKNSECTFCKEYENARGVGELEKQHGYTMYLRACLYSRSNNKKGFEHYSKTSKPMRLRYCPSCGKKLSNA